MENRNYTIKDIARMAGVSAGTVDRVLHNRGDVSEASRAKVRKVLDAIDYRPNMFAIGLAAKKPYHILCILPTYTTKDYWHSVATGVERAMHEMQPFNVTVEWLFYRHGDSASYVEACQRARNYETDAVLIAPNLREETQALTRELDQAGTPYLFIDFNIEQTHALAYIGQDSLASGYLAAKVLMTRYNPGDELAMFLNNQRFNPAEIQMQRRLEGFMSYLAEKHDHLLIHDVVLDKNDTAANERLLDTFFTEHPRVVLGAVFNSRIYQVAAYLRATGRRLNGLLGYDLLPQNCRYLRSGEIHYLIGQRPGLQGYLGIKALCNHVVFKQPVPSVRYMPIDVLVKDNIDYYFEIE